MSKKVLVTGGAGFIGRYLLDELNSKSFSVCSIDRSPDREYINRYSENINIQKCNLLNRDYVNKIVKDFSPNYVIHLAGSKSRSNSLDEFRNVHENNYIGSLNLFNALLNCNNLERVITLGTIDEYGKTKGPFSESTIELPQSAYGLSKLCVSKLAKIYYHQFNLPIVVLRPSIAYGPWQGTEMFIPAIINSLLKGDRFKMTRGEQLRDFIYIDDLVKCILNCLLVDGVQGQIFNVASGQPIKLKLVAEMIGEILGSIELIELGAKNYRSNEIMDYKVSTTKVQRFLDWNPQVELESGLKKTIIHFKDDI